MNARETKNSAHHKFASTRPKAVSLLPEELVTRHMLDDLRFPLVLRPEVEGMDLTSWVKGQREDLEAELLKHGGLLFRGFDIHSVPAFEQLVQAFSTRLMDYLDQHTPRTRMTENIYTSTEYPADHFVPFHSENSKNHVWPLKLWFFCLKPAETGGETPLADNRQVLARLDARIKERFIKKRVMYVRNFGEGLGLPWQTVFQTQNRADVEDYCRQINAEFEWKDGDRLRLRHVCQAVATHPSTGDAVWFNQAHLFHVSSLVPEARESLLSLFDEEDLPGNAYYGDGSRIEDEVIAEVRESFRQSSVAFPWQPGDVLMLDNMLVAHSRTPYTGTREIFVAMAEPYPSV